MKTRKRDTLSDTPAEKTKDTEANMLSRITRKSNVRSTLCWFTESCNSQCLSHFAAPFIVVRAETSITGSGVVHTTESHQRKWTEAQRNPRTTRCFTSRLTLSARHSDFQEKRLLKRQDNASRSSHSALSNSFTLPYVIHVLVGEY